MTFNQNASDDAPVIFVRVPKNTRALFLKNALTGNVLIRLATQTLPKNSSVIATMESATGPAMLISRDEEDYPLLTQAVLQEASRLIAEHDSWEKTAWFAVTPDLEGQSFNYCLEMLAEYIEDEKDYLVVSWYKKLDATQRVSIHIGLREANLFLAEQRLMIIRNKRFEGIDA